MSTSSAHTSPGALPLFSEFAPPNAAALDTRSMPLRDNHQDFVALNAIWLEIARRTNGEDRFAVAVTEMIRKAIDEVIDTPRTNRFVAAELEKTEKTYLGTKIEILFRSLLDVPKGHRLDLLIGGTEVDVKHSMGRNWAIPLEAIDHPCVLISENERTARCNVGLFVAREAYLNRGKNRDLKRTICATSLAGDVWWVLKTCPYPVNFWETIPSERRKLIMNAGGGMRRVAALFREFQQTPISRGLVQAIGQQDDPLRRIRRNGGARDLLAPEGIAILWGRNHRALIEELGLPPIKVDEFISYKPSLAEHIQLLRTAGEID